MQAELDFKSAAVSATVPTPQPEVATFREFAHRHGYDIDASHDRFRFPHGISKRQARDNKRAAQHHLGEALRAAEDYHAAIAAGAVRPPNAAESQLAQLCGHPDNDSVKATWRVSVKRWLRRNPGQTDADAIAALLREKLGGRDSWDAELGADGSFESQVAARVAWLANARTESDPTIAAAAA